MLHDSIQDGRARIEHGAAPLPRQILFASVLSPNLNRNLASLEDVFLSGLSLHLVVDVAAELRFLNVLNRSLPCCLAN